MNSIHPQLLLLQQITGQHCNSSVSLDSCLSGGMLPLKEDTHISASQIGCDITHLRPFIDGIWELFVFHCFCAWIAFTSEINMPINSPTADCGKYQEGCPIRADLRIGWENHLDLLWARNECQQSTRNSFDASLALLGIVWPWVSKQRQVWGKQWQDCFAFRKRESDCFSVQNPVKLFVVYFRKWKKELKMSQLHFHAFNSQPTPSLSTINESNPIEHQNNASHHITNCGTTFSFLFSNNAQITSNSAPSPSQPRVRCVEPHCNVNVSQILLVQGLHGLFRSWTVLFQFSPNSSSTRNEAPGSQHKVNPEGHISGMKGKWENEEGDEEWVE